ncbi:hypothetical protein JCM3766R1_001570 [Sporobolomyces carnicolor]
MDTRPQSNVQHPLRPYSTSSVRPDDFSWHAPTPSRTPPSLRSPQSHGSTSSVNVDQLDHDYLVPSSSLLRAFLTSSFLSFTGVALVQPVEVGKTLAQVQWVPKAGVVEMLDTSANNTEQAQLDVIQDENEAEAYFADLSSVSQPAFQPPPPSSSGRLAPPSSIRPTDPSGYLSGNDLDLGELTRPEWVMPIVVQGGVWDMIKAIARWNGEGYRSLWKGQLTTFVYDTIATSLQPAFLSLLTLIFSPLSVPSFTSLPLIYSPRPLPLLLFTTFSHALTTFVLSPLDLVRTRVIVQSSQPSHRKYSGATPISTLRTILVEEGGFRTTYLHPNLLYPTLIESILKPLLHLSIPLVITRYLHIEPSTSPFLYATTELVLTSASLLVTIPFETIRKRLQLQSRAEFVRNGRVGGVGKPWRSCVELRPFPVHGIVECGWRILTEETGKLPPPKRRRRMSRKMSTPGSGGGGGGGGRAPEFKRSNSTTSQVVVEDLDEDEDVGPAEANGGSAAGGLRQLYRGLSMGVGANVVIFLVGILAGGNAGSGSNGGWAEM